MRGLKITKQIKRPDTPLSETPKPTKGLGLSNIHQGSSKTDPGVLKAKSNKAKAKANMDAYKVKMEANKARALKASTKKK